MPDAKETTKGPTPAPGKRAKAPAAYHVFRFVEGAWEHLTEQGAVPALTTGREEAKKQQAITAATAHLSANERNGGTFAAVKEAEWAPKKGKVREVLDFE